MESGFFEKLDQAYFDDFICEGPDFDVENSVLLKDNFVLTSCSNDAITDIDWLEDDDFIKNEFREEDFERTYKEWERHLTSLRKTQEIDTVISVTEDEEVVMSPDDVVVDTGGVGGNGESTDHLGPDNYDVVEINVEDDDDCVVKIEDVAKSNQVGHKSKRSGTKKNKSKKKTPEDDRQCDHNYCSGDGGRPSFKSSVEEYDAFTVTEEDRWALEKENTTEVAAASPPQPTTTSSSSSSSSSTNAVGKKENASPWYKNPKKDSGLESGEVSDASEGTLSALAGSQPSDGGVSVCAPAGAGVVKETKKDAPKKKKLNLDEYRSRRKFTKVISPRKFGTIAEAILTNEWAKKSSQSQSKMDNDHSSEDRVPKHVVEDDRVKEKSNSEECDKRTHRRRRSTSSSSSGSMRSHNRRPRRRSYRSRSRHRNRTRSTSSGSSSSRSVSGSSRRSRRRNRSRSRSDQRYRSSRRYSEDRLGEKQKQIEERRVVFVGQIEDSVTKSQLRERFKVFGTIVDISLHFRERGDNYGFVTYAHKSDAYKAVEHGNDNPAEPRYDICFGGRRAFCRQRYADLDSMGLQQQSYCPYLQPAAPNTRTVAAVARPSFDALLREAQEKLRKQKQLA